MMIIHLNLFGIPILTLKMLNQFDNEKHLLDRLSKSDHNAFEYVFHRYYARICLFAKGFVPSDFDAEDVAKEAFIRLWNSNKEFQSIAHLKNSIYQFTKQVALNSEQARLRTLNREVNYQIIQEKFEENHLQQIIYAEVMAEIQHAIHVLPDQIKKVIIRSYFDGKSNQEIAQEMGISIQSVKNYKLRAIKHLREQLPRELYQLLISGYFFFEKIL